MESIDRLAGEFGDRMCLVGQNLYGAQYGHPTVTRAEARAAEDNVRAGRRAPHPRPRCAPRIRRGDHEVIRVGGKHSSLRLQNVERNWK